MKSNLRSEARQLRKILSANATMDTATNLAAYFIDGPLVAWKESRPPVIAGYWPFGSEMDTKPLMRILAERGYDVGLPVTDAVGQTLLFRKWQPGMALVRDGMGIESPPPTAPMLAPDIVIAAALAFDKAGHRLGYGTGYYDITLHQLRATRRIIAVVAAFAGQEVETINPGPQDEAVDWIVTEQFSRRIRN